MTVRFEETLLLLLLGGEAWMTLGRWRYRPVGRRTNGQLDPGGKLDVVTAKSGLFFLFFFSNLFRLYPRLISKKKSLCQLPHHGRPSAYSVVLNVRRATRHLFDSEFDSVWLSANGLGEK